MCFTGGEDMTQSSHLCLQQVCLSAEPSSLTQPHSLPLSILSPSLVSSSLLVTGSYYAAFTGLEFIM